MKKLIVSPNKRFLVYEDGTPFFYLGDTAWELAYRNCPRTRPEAGAFTDLREPPTDA